MEPIKRKYLSIIAFIILPLWLFGCTSASNKANVSSNSAEKVTLNSGAVISSEEGSYNLYNYKDEKYSNINVDDVVLAYDKESSNYICIDNGVNYFISNGEKYDIKDNNISALKLSKEGKYISYFIQDNGLKLKIYNTCNNEEIKINSNVTISGTLYDWYDKNTIVYYGVSKEGINGLFTYNLEENKEELLYKIKEGFLAYLKGNQNDVLFLQITLENKKAIMVINKNTKNVETLSLNMDEIKDIIRVDDKYYAVGKGKDNVESLYEIKKNSVKRLVYDFPSVIKIEKGLMADDNGNILFIGSKDGESSQEQIYKYANDGTVSLVQNNGTDYTFVKYIN
ncbi:MAG: hypothetical protein E7207_08855 [Clostridium butyricum]|nr:hypothetical protein [Clostridium butyricum]